jgi:hypothetical protein
VSAGLDTRLEADLDDHAQIACYLRLDFERPTRSIGDGYPENAIAWVGRSPIGCRAVMAARPMCAGHPGALQVHPQGADHQA